MKFSIQEISSMNLEGLRFMENIKQILTNEEPYKLGSML